MNEGQTRVDNYYDSIKLNFLIDVPWSQKDFS